MPKKEKHFENSPEFRGLKVNDGVIHPGSYSNDSIQRFLSKERGLLSVDEYLEGILSGNITLLSKAVTLIESSRPMHQEIAQEIISRCLPYSGNSIRIGITGVPGAGKSTFIEALGSYITGRGSKLAVLAIDPSSERSKGSILGDKTRMQKLARDKNAYIRPSPSEGSLGGVARKTRETIVLCEAAGFNHIFIETVGVGQSEIAVHSMTDFFLLLMLAGAGDELQGIKRGIMEMADLIAINKADGNNLDKAGIAQMQYSSALHLFPQKESGWEPKALTCSSLENTGITEIWDEIETFRKQTNENGFFHQKRNAQAAFWMHETIQEQIKQMFYAHPKMKNKIEQFEKQVLNNEVSSFVAAGQLLEIYKVLK